LRDEVLWSKRESIERCIRRVREEYVGHEAEFATNHTRQDAIVLNLQRACEASIDMVNRMIKLRRLGYPKESKESFRLLQRAGLIGKAIADAMAAMVGFRNVAVHDCQDLDLTKVRAIIEHRLDDLLSFSGAMLEADPSAARPPS
jgi:uncharacterized protein YutE (UPF0331/DUF86 family)